MKQEVGSILGLLLPLTQNLSCLEPSEALDQQDDMQAMLLQLKGVAQNLVQVSSPQVNSVAHSWPLRLAQAIACDISLQI